ncbi:MAG: 2TM domain-containing protein [Bacteroidia bacterium]|nr:2TM domain-containing protein [Bacteroidia bacterium]MBT8269194.1 2TM domain-containing protein [Bacteroidia bacterium]NNF81530.1 2TM domain-containing protein [Flavobacteriaceae bacterium]NNK69565.1 2TM domain-containing protein [Flavobacteriaceae bacterium]NNL81197.1 2TM domain-containing protein [Flavobacteriaceae bacterium]
MAKYEIEPYKDPEEGRSYEREEAYLRAKKKLDKLVGFYWHLAVYLVVNTVLIIIIGVNRDDGVFWDFGTFATALFWGIGLAFHFLGVFGPDFFFGKNWEDRKIKEYMNQDRKDMTKFE